MAFICVHMYVYYAMTDCPKQTFRKLILIRTANIVLTIETDASVFFISGNETFSKEEMGKLHVYNIVILFHCVFWMADF